MWCAGVHCVYLLASGCSAVMVIHCCRAVLSESSRQQTAFGPALMQWHLQHAQNSLAASNMPRNAFSHSARQVIRGTRHICFRLVGRYSCGSVSLTSAADRLDSRDRLISGRDTSVTAFCWSRLRLPASATCPDDGSALGFSLAACDQQAPVPRIESQLSPHIAAPELVVTPDLCTID